MDFEPTELGYLLNLENRRSYMACRKKKKNKFTNIYK